MIRHLPAGSTYRVTIDYGVLIAATVTRQSWEPLGLHDGAEVVAALKATAPHVIRCSQKRCVNGARNRAPKYLD
jgi:molybdopterin-binding protein